LDSLGIEPRTFPRLDAKGMSYTRPQALYVCFDFNSLTCAYDQLRSPIQDQLSEFKFERGLGASWDHLEVLNGKRQVFSR